MSTQEELLREAARGRAALAAGEPVISVDTKKKELAGDFKNAGHERRPRGDPPPARKRDQKAI